MYSSLFLLVKNSHIVHMMRQWFLQIEFIILFVAVYGWDLIHWEAL